ncbi:MAG: 50S ribosomal protein L29 [Magnetococcales bacterium]|nr:50S ribosomal protein L29 [Magnetococcales bacterium]
MNAKDVRGQDGAALQAKLQELHQESFNLRFRKATNQLENTARIRQVKKDIARIMTIMHERTVAQSASKET